MKTELSRTEKASRIMLAILVGALIWAAAIDEERFSVDVEIPLILEVDSEYMIMENTGSLVNVRLIGSGLEMLSYQISSPLTEMSKHISVGSTSAFPHNLAVGLVTSDVHPDGQVDVSLLTPDQASVTIDTVVSRRLPVSVAFHDGIPSRFRLFSVDPDYVTVTGPSSVVSNMDSISTEAVNVSSGHTTASLAFNGDMVAYSDALVRVTITKPDVPVAGLD
ncbi:MAG: CdaR family protein [Candidatus Fermentibacteria bacterium]|nr:CdaR family protein [Candidatus Fermentibacteria bacterium]